MKSEIWPYYRGFYKVYTEDYEAVKKIASWQGCKRSCTYHNQKGQIFGWDLIFPAKLYNRVAALVELPLRIKSPNRQRHGQDMADKNRQHQFIG